MGTVAKLGEGPLELQEAKPLADYSGTEDADEYLVKQEVKYVKALEDMSDEAGIQGKGNARYTILSKLIDAAMDARKRVNARRGGDEEAGGAMPDLSGKSKEELDALRK